MSDLPVISSSGGREALREFHLTGKGANLEAKAPCPAAAAALLDPERRWRDSPFVLLNGAETPGDGMPVAALASMMSRALEAAPEPSRVLAGRLPQLARLAVQRLNRDGAGSPVRDVVRGALEALLVELQLDESGVTALRAEIERLHGALPRSGVVLAPGRNALITLYHSAVRRDRDRIAGAFLDEARTLALRLSGLLQLDASHGPDANTPDVLAGELGDAAGALLDSAALSRMVPEHRGPMRLTAERRSRIERALAVLERHVRQAEKDPVLVLVHSGTREQELELPGVETVEATDGLEQVARIFDEKSERTLETLRALRVARLEIEDAYEPERHDAALERFDWRSVTRDELRLLPCVAVLDRVDRLRSRGIGPLSDLLRSGRPVHVLLLEEPLPASPADLARTGIEVGYMAAAHLDAFVLQSTLAQPEHLFAGLSRMAGAACPAVAVVAVPLRESELGPELELSAAHESRSTPCFRFDPESGDTWADCFDVEANPEPELHWPMREVRYVDEHGAEHTRRDAFTFAHAVALVPALRGHFRAARSDDWDANQIEIADYLELAPSERRHKLPFIWMQDDDRRPVRAVITHELAAACRERLRMWRIFLELAGIDNPHARRAAESVEVQTQSQSDESIRQLAAEHAQALEQVREQARQQALEQFVTVLMDVEGAMEAPATTVEAPAPAAPAAEPRPDAGLAAPSEPEREEPGASLPPAGPYIDTPLCTSCNECTNLNSRMFRYNEDKQAYVADATAGTFLELVKAAEKCPARCIHPGQPRPGDKTVNDKLLARAARFD